MKARIGSLLVIVAAAVVITATAAVALPPEWARTEADKVAADIRALNIINQLNLTQEQLDRILPVVREDAAERFALTRQREEAEPAMLAALTQLRSELRDGFNTQPQSERAFHQVKEPLERAFEAYLDNHQKRAQQVLSVLSPNQQVLLAEYKPCVVPLKDYKDPARIGQASAASGVEKALEQIRQMPERAYQRTRQRRAQALAERLHKYYSEDEIPAKIREFEQVAAQARAMPEVEFRVKKSEMAARVAPPEKAPARGKALVGRAAEFLMSANVLPLLERRRELILAQTPKGAAR